MTISKEAIEAGLRITLSSVNMPAGECLHETDVREILEAALPFLPIAVEGKVKALEWKDEGGEYIAQSVIGWFHIGRPASYWNLTTPHGVVSSHETRDEAKAAAQSDYETRILSALSSSPGKDGGQGRILPDNEDFRQGYSVGYADAYGDVSDLKAKLTALKGAHSPQPASTALVEAAWEELCNADDRTSPEAYPDMCLITRGELADFMSRATRPVDEPPQTFGWADLPGGAKRAMVSELQKARSSFMISDFEIAENIVSAMAALSASQSTSREGESRG